MSNLRASEIARYLGVIVNGCARSRPDPSFPSPVENEHYRRWDRAPRSRRGPSIGGGARGRGVTETRIGRWADSGSEHARASSGRRAERGSVPPRPSRGSRPRSLGGTCASRLCPPRARERRAAPRGQGEPWRPRRPRRRMPHRSLTTEYVWEHRHLGNVPLAMDRPTMNTSDVGRYLHVTRERARQIVNGRDSFPTPVVTDPRRRWDVRFRVGRRERRRWLTGSQSPRSGRCERRGTRKIGPVRPQAIRSPQRQQPSTPALVLHPRSLGRHLGLRGVDEVAQHLPADRRIALQQPLHNRIVLGHRRRSWLVRALILRRLHP